ncbi:DNA integrity scanning protein DisA nucleotide-binding domain protein [soil metagenome]
MSLPQQTVALLQAARDMAKGLPADAVLLLVETPLDWDEVQQKLIGCRLFVAAENPALTESLHESEDWNVIDLDSDPMPIQERMSNALLKAITDEQLKPGAHVVVLYNGIATLGGDAPEPIDSLSVLHLGEHLERMTAADLRKLGSGIPQDVLKSVVDLATEIGREGREGHPIGTVIVVGDTRKVQTMSRFLNFNPFRGYTRTERDIRDRKVREQIKEVAKLDGAILIGRDGIAEAACVYLDVPTNGITLSKGFGTRHLSAAAISLKTKAVAFCVSQSSGTTRVFQDGIEKLRIEPLDRPHVWQPLKLEAQEEE